MDTDPHPARPGITLVEVLAAIFIMGVGLLALLTLFPLGALSMARAVRDDRAAAIAANAAATATALDLRNDPNVVAVPRRARPPGILRLPVPAFTPRPQRAGLPRPGRSDLLPARADVASAAGPTADARPAAVSPQRRCATPVDGNRPLVHLPGRDHLRDDRPAEVSPASRSSGPAPTPGPTCSAAPGRAGPTWSR